MADLLRILQYNMLHKNEPYMIILHVGGNNVATSKLHQFLPGLHRDVKYIQSVFSNTLIVWSDILPRLTWKYAVEHNEKLLDLKRKRINRSARQAVTLTDKGRIITYKIDRNCTQYFLPDGTHLNIAGNTVFTSTLKNAVQQFMCKGNSQNKYI